MAQFLNNLLNASIHGSVVILAVILLRLLLRKTPKKYICLLWLLAGIRLLMPIEIRSELSLQPELSLPNWNLPALLPWVWGIVAICFGIYSLISYLKLKKQVREAVRIRGGWECDRIDTAFILGFIKPKIYIPMGMTRQARKHILEHERTHLDKGDHWIKMIGFLALALHWFNPFVWMAYIFLCRDIEMACDERVVQFMELEERKSYSAALLSCSSKQLHFSANPVAFGEVSVKQRILSVLNYKKPAFWAGLLGVVAFFFVAVCLLTSPMNSAPTVVPEPLSPEQQQAQSQLEKYHADLEELFDREEFYYETYASTEQGSVMWQTGIFKQGGNLMWKYTPSSSPDVTDGRLYYEGQLYAYHDGGWVETNAQDPEFDQWTDLFRWNSSTAELVEEKQNETGCTVVFTCKWESEDETVHTSNVSYSYNNSGALQNIRIENPNHPTASRVYLDVIPVSQMWGEPREISEFFIEAENTITEGSISGDELALQAEFNDWEVHFRVDDDRLSANGSDVYFSQGQTGRGVISTTERYWFEKKVGGDWKIVPTVNEPHFSDDGIGVAKESATYGYLDWTPIYGSLEPGDYRMGKVFQCYDSQTRYSKEHTFYSEFSIFETVDSSSPEAKAAVERCYVGFDELKARDHIHFKTFMGWIEETWINGSNYVRTRDFGNENDDIPENNGRIDINARWDGIGYSQVREDPEVRGSKVLGMQLSTLDANRNGWVESLAETSNALFFDRDNKAISFPEGIGVISDEMVRFVQSWTLAGGDTYQAQLTYQFDENGKLYYMDYKPLDEGSEVSYWIEVFDTTPEEIDAKIKPYTENLYVAPFSWNDAKAKYTDEEFNIRESNFVCSGGSPITGPVDAAKLALKEYPNLGDYLSLDVFRDETTGMWKVTIESYVDYQSTYAYRDVYLSDSGATQLLVYEGPIGYDESRK